MIIDTSALVAILKNEPERPVFLGAMAAARTLVMSAGNFLETAIVVDGLRRPELSRKLEEFVTENNIQVVPFTPAQAKLAREAYRDFGKGSGHPARLNFGDCIAYALAKDAVEPLLYKGTDFHHTDVRSAV